MTETLVDHALLDLRTGDLKAEGPAVEVLRRQDVDAIEVLGVEPEELLADGDIVRVELADAALLTLDDRVGYLVAVLRDPTDKGGKDS